MTSLRSIPIATLVGLAALAFSALYFLSDLIEAIQGGFSASQLGLTLVAEAAIPGFVIGLSAAQRPQIGALGRISAVAYAYSYVFFTGTVVYALIDGTSDYNALSHDLGPWMTIHGAIMVLAGLGFGFAVMRAGVLPRWTAITLMAGVVLVSLSQDLPAGAQLFAAAIRDLGFAGMGAALLGLHLASGKPVLRTDDLRASTRPDGSALRWVLGAVASALVVCVIAAPAAAAAPPDRAALARMDRVIRDGMERSGMPGFAVAVVSGNDEVHARGFGDTGNGGRVTPQTPFLLGSTSKSFTALAAMQLVDAGKLDLDAPARRYVREFQLADQRAADRITVRQVLQQTTGMPATAGGPILRSAADGTALEALQELRDTTLATPPGAAFEYANANYVLAGLIVERASGEPYAQYVQRHIFTPLGMRNSYVTLDAAQRAGLATGHRYWFGLNTAHGPTFRRGIQSAGYLISSAQDMALYLAMYLNDGVAADGERIVSQRGLDTMLAPGRPGTLGPWSDHADARYAMGWYVGGPWSEPAQLHPGRAPDSSALMVMFPRRDLAVVTLTNAANQLSLPGYPASVDRVERNAVDALIGDPVDTGTSLHRYYVYVDLIALALLAALTWAVIRAVRALRTRTRPRRRWLAIAGVVTRAGGGVLLVALPALTFGWRASFLWQPDVFTVIVLIGTLLLVTAALRLARLVRRAPNGPQEGPASGTVPAETDPAPALVAR